MMTVVRRSIYFAYYLRRMDWQMLQKFMDHVQAKLGWSKSFQWRNVIKDSFRLNISILEYYQFRFFELSECEKEKWAGTGTMYEFQRVANPPATREILSDKRAFYKAYRSYFRHDLYALSDLRSDPELARQIVRDNHVLVFKEAKGNCGAGIAFERVEGMTPQKLLDLMKIRRFDLVETVVVQHSRLNALSPSAVNTVRIFTQINSTSEYQVLGCRLRISVDSPIDNLAAGNIAAPIDTDTGVVTGPGVYSDITLDPVETHPVTNCKITGFQVPHWDATLAMVREASLLHPENRSVGWDIVITPEGPGLIEGNHDWCKLVWQLPVDCGLKHMLDICE